LPRVVSRFVVSRPVVSAFAIPVSVGIGAAVAGVVAAGVPLVAVESAAAAGVPLVAVESLVAAFLWQALASPAVVTRSAAIAKRGAWRMDVISQVKCVPR
jgi:hypothetical protein